MHKKKKILFFVDHKYRDLYSLSLISYYLRKFNFVTRLTALWNFKELDKFKPDYVVFNKPQMFDREKIKNIIYNRFNICIPTEGQAHNRQPIVHFHCDLNFFWNKYCYDKVTDICKSRKVLAGCPRTDHLNIANNKSIKKNNHIRNLIRNKKKNITFAIPDLSSKISSEKMNDYCKNIDKSHLSNVKYYDYIKFHKKAALIQKNIIAIFSKKIKKYNFIIKPHPNDDFRYWQEFLKKENTNKNIFLIYNTNIKEFLDISSLHITIEGCNTTFEASMKNIQSAEIILDKKIRYLELDKITRDLSDYKIEKTKDFRNIFNSIFVKKQKKNNQVKLKKYIKHHFYKIDDKRCLRYAEEIKKFIILTSSYSYLSRLTFLFKQILLNINNYKYIFFIFKEFFKKLINYKTNHKAYLFKKIDDRGRFDSRIKNNDDLVLYNFFKKNLKI